MDTKTEELIKIEGIQEKDILDNVFYIYNYKTEDTESGTIILHENLRTPFDNNSLFVMENKSVKRITLRELLKKGFVSLGSTDCMETLDITYPLIGDDKPTIKGKYMHGSRKNIAVQTNIDFKFDPESEEEKDVEYEEI